MEDIADMAVKIAIANQKGGVGKTTTALALADGLRIRGKSVLLIDTDPQRNSTMVYGAKTEDVATLYDIIFAGYTAEQCIQATDHGDIIASDEQLQSADTQIKPSPKMYKYLKSALKTADKKYDYIIFDTPPRTGILLGNVLEAAEYVIIPITCDIFGIQGLMDFYQTVKEYQDDNEILSIMGLLKIKYKGRQSLTRDIEERLRLFGADVKIKRIALTVEQIQTYNPPPAPAKVGDSRTRKYIQENGAAAWEVDALDPEVLHDLIQEEVINLIDIDKFNLVYDLETKQRAELFEMARNYNRIQELLKQA